MDANFEQPRPELQTEVFKPVPVDQELVKPPHPLKVKLAETQTRIRSQLRSSADFLETHRENYRYQVDGVASQEELSSELELLSEMETTPEDYLTRSGQALAKTEQFVNSLDDRKEPYEAELYKLYEEKFRLESELKKLEEKKGLGKIIGYFKKRSLNNQKIQNEWRTLSARSEIGMLDLTINHLTYYASSVGERRQEEKLNLYQQDCQVLWEEYNSLYQEVLADNSLTTQIREAYYEVFILHEVDSYFEEHKRFQDNRDEILGKLKDFVVNSESFDRDRNDQFLTELSALYPDSHLRFYLSSALDKLAGDADVYQITKFLAYMAAKDFRQLQEIYTSQLTHWNTKGKITQITKETIDPSFTVFSGKNIDFGGLLMEQMSDRDDKTFANMPLWKALTQSSLAKEIFGETLINRDRELYEYYLEQSLTDRDGNIIDRLYFYPTPESVRNIMLLAAADYSSYRTVHANGVLTEWAKRKDWGEILNNFVEEYPEFGSARYFVEEWNYHRQDTRPGTKKAFAEFVMALLDDESLDDKLKKLCFEALPNAGLIDKLVGEGLIEDAVMASKIKEAEILLLNKNREIRDIPYGDPDYYSIWGEGFNEVVREKLQTLNSDFSPEQRQYYLEPIIRLSKLSEAILQNADNNRALEYLTYNHLIEYIGDIEISEEHWEILFSAYESCPSLVNYPGLMEEFLLQFSGQETVDLFAALEQHDVYTDDLEIFSKVAALVGGKKLTKERALELPYKAAEVFSSPVVFAALEFPELFLATDDDVGFFVKLSKAYDQFTSGANNPDFIHLAERISGDLISRELALEFPVKASGLMSPEMKELRVFVLNRANLLIKDETDLKFLNQVVGEFGKKADIFLRGYHQCLEQEVVTLADKAMVLEFGRQFRVITPKLIKEYKEAKASGFDQVFLAQLKAVAGKLTGAPGMTDKEREMPFYQDLLMHVYANNSGTYGSFKSNESCSDRSEDLTGFKLRNRYDIDLMSQSQIRVGEGQVLDREFQQSVQEPIYRIFKEMDLLGFDSKVIREKLDEKLTQVLNDIVNQGGLPGIDPNKITEPSHRLFLIMTDSIYGNKLIDSHAVKDLLLSYEFAYFEDISDYIAGTNDRISRANNRDYALLCELGAFYGDRIKEVNRLLVEAAWKNPAIRELMPSYFQKLSQEVVTSGRKTQLNKLQADRLGLSDTFVNQIGRVLTKRRGREYSSGEVKEIIRRYEAMTGGLTADGSDSKKATTRAFYGQLRSQRQKTFEALRVITGQETEPKNFHLGLVNMEEMMRLERQIEAGRYDEEQFAAYTGQRLIDIFEDEKVKIEDELLKFETISGNKREVLYGYITKSKESANARMVGGVCVSADNPDKNPNQNMWDMPNFFQLVLQEPDTYQCQGLALLHHFSYQGKRILTASVNPSSTYLYSVDEEALFKGIMQALETFASDNGFDQIAFSQNRTIRTNRTGGQFEKAMDERVALVNKAFSFDPSESFSYYYRYVLQDMDVVWER